MPKHLSLLQTCNPRDLKKINYPFWSQKPAWRDQQISLLFSLLMSKMIFFCVAHLRAAGEQGSLAVQLPTTNTSKLRASASALRKHQAAALQLSPVKDAPPLLMHPFSQQRQRRGEEKPCPYPLLLLHPNVYGNFLPRSFSKERYYLALALQMGNQGTRIPAARREATEMSAKQGWRQKGTVLTSHSPG